MPRLRRSVLIGINGKQRPPGWKPWRPSQARHGTSPSDWRTRCLTSINPSLVLGQACVGRASCLAN